MKTRTTVAALVSLMGVGTLATRAMADPLPGEVLKFQQLPLNLGLAPSTGGAPYPGHDERSTAYGVPAAGGGLLGWQGNYMADDFADKVSTPIVHIKWWGSYLQQPQPTSGLVPKFLISIESDVPVGPQNPLPFSHPGVPLLNQIVTAGTLAPGTFTETLINGSVPEHLFQYNAELAVPFPEQAGVVYWLKIVALVDDQQSGIVWGWHDRDYSIFDPYALSPSTIPALVPGERIIGALPIPGDGTLPIWHFQDDAVAGPVGIPLPLVPTGPGSIIQDSWTPQNYVEEVDGPPGISQFSKDLAFELYTTPEPGSMLLLSAGVLVLARRRQR